MMISFTSFLTSTTLLALAFGGIAASVVAAAEETSNNWKVLDVKLPTPLSDNTATYIESTDMIYIAGGCNSPKGNTYVDADGLELDFFLCESDSQSLYSFDGTTFTTMADMPQPRYRHAAVVAQNKLWLIGGRTIPEDSIIADVDMYDPVTNEWTTVGQIPEEYLTSDNGAFTNADETKVYVVGGYPLTYFNPDALAITFSFDVEAAVAAAAAAEQGSAGDLVITRHADLNTQRGDIHAVTSTDGKKAYVAGGASSYPCEPLSSSEVYDIDADEWTKTDGDLLLARLDHGLVYANGGVYAIGGEVSHPQQCAAPELVPPLSAQSLAVQDVELLLSSSSDTEQQQTWEAIIDIPEFRFRFSAEFYPSTETVYAFGGQTSFNDECKCFPTSDEVTALSLSTSSSPGTTTTTTTTDTTTGEEPVDQEVVSTASSVLFSSSIWIMILFALI